MYTGKHTHISRGAGEEVSPAKTARSAITNETTQLEIETANGLDDSEAEIEELFEKDPDFSIEEYGDLTE